MITAPISFGELVDKITILELKKHYIKDEKKQESINHELKLLILLYEKEKSINEEEIEDYKFNLSLLNHSLWIIEDDIRNKERKQEFDKEFIRFARSVYLKNDERAALKRKLNKIVNSDIIEEKSYQKY
jgi:hypothetical protein